MAPPTFAWTCCRRHATPVAGPVPALRGLPPGNLPRSCPTWRQRKRSSPAPRSCRATSGAWPSPAERTDGAHPSATMLLIPALNEMFDITPRAPWRARCTRRWSSTHCCSVSRWPARCLPAMAWRASKSRSWIYVIGFAAVMAIAVNVIIDIEYPRRGLIRVDAFDQVLVRCARSARCDNIRAPSSFATESNHGQDRSRRLPARPSTMRSSTTSRRSGSSSSPSSWVLRSAIPRTLAASSSRCSTSCTTRRARCMAASSRSRWTCRWATC